MILPRPVVAAAKDATITALVAAGLFVPMIGLRTDVAPAGNLYLRERWGLVALLVALAFAGRLCMLVWRGARGEAPRVASAQQTEILRRAGRAVAPVALGLAFALPLLPGTGRYELDLGILVLTYVMLGWGLNIVVGLAGLLDLGYVAFYAVGAYAFALLAKNFVCRSGSACRSPEFSRASGAFCWAFQCCACAATTSPS